MKKTHTILVDRLQALWDPREALCLIHDMSWLTEVKPLGSFRAERRGIVYHRRRIRHFVDCLLSGEPMDPIEVDNHCDRHAIYPIPVVVDGNHRLIAHMITNKPTIQAFYGGRVDLLRYLEGKRLSVPV